ncbi:hypothetical protein EV363DRAFT_1159004, partial [Boletus edulis]
EPHALQSVARKVYNEMDDVQHILSGTIDTLSPDVGHQFDGWEDHILKCPARSDRASRENSVKDIHSDFGL